VRALGEATDALQRAAGALMEFFMSGKIDQVTLFANAFLESMAEVTIASLLLQAAIIADTKRETGDDQSQEDYDFYSGKVMAAKYYVNYVLPGVHSKVGAMVAADRSPLDIPDQGFSTAY
jgi:F0F1-type ATP synthase gamma subunit